MKTPTQLRLESDRAAEQERASRSRANNRRFRKRNISGGNFFGGDRTNNTPDLRKNTKFKNKLDLPQSTYLLSEPKQGGLPLIARENDPKRVDEVRSMALLTHYRYIIASNRGTK